MGLDAVVYKHRENVQLEDKRDYEVIQLDEETGEVYIEAEDARGNYSRATFIALRKRLGNMTSISQIRVEVRHVLHGNDSFLLEKVLYSGVHCGDMIESTDLNQLETEIDFVEQQTHDHRSSMLSEFLHDMKELIQAAREQGNPIVFV